MAGFEILDAVEKIDALLAAADHAEFPAWDDHPLYGRFGRNLGAAINADRQRHTSAHFAVVDNGVPIVLVPATYDDDAVSMYGHPLTLAMRNGLGRKRQKQAFAAAFERLRQVACEHAVKRIRILGTDSGNPLQAVDLACIDQRASPQSHIHGVVDTVHDEQSIHRQLRDSYRSLVNWGREQLEQVYINADNPDRKRFDLYPAFHDKIAGAAHYNDAYWDTYWNDIVNGRGELSLGFLSDGQLVTGTMVIDAAATAYYASGVYERELFDKPLGHFPVFDSIVRAGQRGMTRYDLGEIYPDGAASEKEVQIGFFKKGFTSTFVLRTVWVLDTP